MAMNLPAAGGDDQAVSAINTTPLVDVMLVLLIIFLITIPVVNFSVPVALPKLRNQVRESQPSPSRAKTSNSSSSAESSCGNEANG